LHDDALVEAAPSVCGFEQASIQSAAPFALENPVAFFPPVRQQTTGGVSYNLVVACSNHGFCLSSSAHHMAFTLPNDLLPLATGLPTVSRARHSHARRAVRRPAAASARAFSSGAIPNLSSTSMIRTLGDCFSPDKKKAAPAWLGRRIPSLQR
jgi:hypothetical protein